MNPGTKPAEGAGTARSKAVLELTLIVVSGEKRVWTSQAAFAFAFVGVGLPTKAAFGPTWFWWMYIFLAAAALTLPKKHLTPTTTTMGPFTPRNRANPQPWAITL